MVPFSAFTEPFWMALDAGWFRIPRNWNKRRKTETVREKDWVSIFGVQWAKISLVTGKKAHKTCSVLNVLPYSATCSQCRHGHWKQLNSSIGIPSPKANWHFGCSSYAHHIRLKQSSNHLPSLHHINSNSYSARKRLTTNWSWISCTHMHDYEATCTAYLVHWEKKKDLCTVKPEQLLQTSAVTTALAASHLHGFPSATVLSRRLKNSDGGLMFFVSRPCCKCRAARAEAAPPLGLDTCLDTTRINWIEEHTELKVFFITILTS